MEGSIVLEYAQVERAKREFCCMVILIILDGQNSKCLLK